jgi:small-conductance mechanosensitive channel
MEPGARVRIIAAFLFTVACLIPWHTAVINAQSSEIGTEQPDKQTSAAPVKLDGELLFYVHGVTAFPAEERAAAISKRIRRAASDPQLTADSVRIVSGDDHVKVYAGSEFIMNVYDSDAELEGISRDMMADVVRRKTGLAMDVYRLARSGPVLLNRSLRALGAILLLAVILFLLRWSFRRINSVLQQRIKKRIDSVENISFRLIQSNQIWKAFHLLIKTIRIGITVILIAVVLNYILGLFPWTSNVAAYTLQLFLDPIVAFGKGILHFLPSLAFLIIIFVVTRYLLKLVRLLFAGLQQGGIEIKDFDPDWAMPTFKILRVLIIAFAVIIAYPYIPGSESNAFKGVTLFIGVLFSLGSSSFISNLIAGYSMTYRGAFKKGDRIQVNDHIGFVEEQKLLVTRLRSLKNEEIIIPNSVLLNSSIVNYSARAKDLGLIIHTTVGIGYETPWRQVDAMLKLAADRTEGLLKNPPPYVLKQSLGDFAVNYEINAYCNDVSRMHLCYTALHQHILDVFNENNVQIMTPAYEGDPEIPKVVPKDQWDTPLVSDK